MQTTRKKDEKRRIPYSLIADTVGTNRVYVGQVMRDPENNNGPTARRIKYVAREIEQHTDKLKSFFEDK